MQTWEDLKTSERPDTLLVSIFHLCQTTVECQARIFLRYIDCAETIRLGVAEKFLFNCKAGRVRWNINILLCPQSEKYLVATVVSTIFDGSPRSAGNMAEFSVSRCNERTISIRKLDQVVGISRRSVVDQDYALQPSLD